jgi:hypothetical protein
MLARIGVTLAAALLALIAFLGGGPTEAGPLNPFGLLFVFLAVLAWCAWDAVSGGYASHRTGDDGAELPLVARFAPVFIKGVTKGVADLGGPQQKPPSTAEVPSAPAARSMRKTR